MSFTKSFLMVMFGMTLLINNPSLILAQTAGSISGTVIDAATGEGMVGAVVRLDGTRLGAVCDIDGSYFISGVPEGLYTLIAVMVGYPEVRIENVAVVPGEDTTLEPIAIAPEAIEIDEITVKARAIRNTEEALIQERKEEDAVTDAVSAEAISSAGSGDAAQAMNQVTGATVVGGKEVYVRGLGDRYMNVQLNGSELPSTSQYRRTVQMDMFPAGLLDNIVTQKTFTPDKPGSFTGGSVDIETRSFPDQLTFSFSSSATYNSQSSLSDGFLTYEGGESDWLATDDGTRDIPDELSSPDVLIPDLGAATHDLGKAELLDTYTRAFNRTMYPDIMNTPFNQSYALTVGNQTPVFGRQLGYIASLTYANSYSHYEDGEYNRWKLTGQVDKKNELDSDLLMQDVKSTREVTFGGLANISWRLAENHEISLNTLLNRTGEDEVRLLEGSFPEADIKIEDDRTYHASVLHYNDRALSSAQLKGDHTLRWFGDISLEWRGSYAIASQDEPDMRYFNYHTQDRIYQGEEVRVFSISVNQYRAPNRYFRTLDEIVREAGFDLTVPLNDPDDESSQEKILKVGAFASSSDRDFRERRFQYNLTRNNYLGEETTVFADSVFAEGNLGLITDSVPYKFGTHIIDSSEDRSNYDGTQDIAALYGMADFRFLERLRLIAGLRYESTRMETASADTTYESGIIDTDDILPAVNLVVDFGEVYSIRGAYGRTLARPSFREMAPFPSDDFAGGYIFTGNPNLKRTLIDNFDLRWERYGEPGEIFSVSLFAKFFHDPIEQVILNVNHEISYQNVDEARVQGIELELRKNLGTLSERLSPFRVGGNLSLVSSEVDIPEREMEVKQASDPDAASIREFQGQSPYVVNIDINYNNEERGITATLYYNTFGRRMSESSIGATPAIFEQPRHTLNISFKKSFGERFSLSCSAKNILDADYEWTQSFKGKDYTAAKYSSGRSFSVGVSYSM